MEDFEATEPRGEGGRNRLDSAFVLTRFIFFFCQEGSELFFHGD